ncbi:MAG TPA: hemerythrin domain-containing protein [Pseudonocardia sp.]|nr:hemerythrin domain-containing protein [Pseudonocardia sp.]
MELLLHQHGQIHDLFAEVRASEADARRHVFGRLVRLLAMHETAEEMIVHPVARTVLHQAA